ncbi:MAG: class III extradiol ring-cleavage dioxygenase [Methylococcales bacterium]
MIITVFLMKPIKSNIQYPALGSTTLANKIYQLLNQHGIDAKLDDERGFDHGVFIPLKIMFPDASIPCVQLSLLSSLDAQSHIQIGKALAELRKENVLVIGSGFSFHNMKAFFSSDINETDSKNNAFQDWLIDSVTNPNISVAEKEKKLIAWHNAPSASYCHPREEHLLPLHICFGLSYSNAKVVFDDDVARKRVCAFLW